MYDNAFVKEMINACKMNMRTAHEEIGISKPIASYDDEPPSYEELEEIADYFNVSTDSLLGRTPNKTRDAIMESLKFTSLYPYNLIEAIIGEPIDWELDEDNIKALDWAMSRLKERQAQILLKYYKEGNTYREIGETYGCCGQRVGQVIKEALRILRHPVYYRAILDGMHSFAEVDEYAEATSKRLDEREKQLDEREKSLNELEQFLTQRADAIANLDSKMKKVPIAAMNLSSRALNCLAHEGIESMGEVKAMLDDDPYKFLRIKNFGKKSGEEVVRRIDELLDTGGRYLRIFRSAIEKTLDEREDSINEHEQFFEQFLNQRANAIANPNSEMEKMSIEEMNLSTRALNCLGQAGIESLGEVKAMLDDDPYKFLCIKNFGKKSGEEVVRRIDDLLDTGGKYLRIFQSVLKRTYP